MACTVFGGGGLNNVSSTNIYAMPFGSQVAVSTENLRQFKMRVAGVLSNYSMTVNANGTSRVSTYRDNSVDAKPTLNFPDSTSGFFIDSAHGYRIAVGDTVGVRHGFSGAAFAKYGFATRFDADSGTVGFHFIGEDSTTTGTTYYALSGQPQPTEGAGAHTTMRAPGTAQNMFVAVSANTSAAATAFSSRKNSAAGNLSISVAGTTTGLFEDTSHTDSLSNGDTFGFAYTATNSSATFVAGCNIAYSTQVSEVSSGWFNISWISSGTFTGLLVTLTSPQSTESRTQTCLSTDGVLSNMRVNVVTNNSASVATAVLRKNGVSGNQTVSMAANATGTFEDSTNTDKFVASDKLNTEWSNVDSSGVASVSWVSFAMTPYMSPQRFLKRTYLRR